MEIEKNLRIAQTVGELIEELAFYDKDMPVVFKGINFCPDYDMNKGVAIGKSFFITPKNEITEEMLFIEDMFPALNEYREDLEGWHEKFSGLPANEH